MYSNIIYNVFQLLWNPQSKTDKHKLNFIMRLIIYKIIWWINIHTLKMFILIL